MPKLSPAVGVVAAGAVVLFLAGRNLNQTTITSTAVGGPRPLWSPFAFRFGRPFRHPADQAPNRMPPPGQPGGPQGPQPPVAPGTLPDLPLPGTLPQTDSAAPPYNDTTVLSSLIPQPRPGINYVEAGTGDNLYTLSMRTYNTPLRSVDIFNANRQGVMRADGTPGIMASPDFIEPGTRIIIPGGGIT